MHIYLYTQCSPAFYPSTSNHSFRVKKPTRVCSLHANILRFGNARSASLGGILFLLSFYFALSLLNAIFLWIVSSCYPRVSVLGYLARDIYVYQVTHCNSILLYIARKNLSIAVGPKLSRWNSSYSPPLQNKPCDSKSATNQTNPRIILLRSLFQGQGLPGIANNAEEWVCHWFPLTLKCFPPRGLARLKLWQN